MQKIVITTEDQSKTIFVPDLNENYRSIHGAIRESQHVFIEAGIKYFNKKKISIFEMGFGTALNAYLSYLFAEKNTIDITYYTIEKYPLDKVIYSELNYTEILGCKSDIFNKMHECKWNKWNNISSFFRLFKIKGDIKEYKINFKYDIVYFDAFGPVVQPEIWQENIFRKIIDALNPEGIITTYSAKGSVKRILKSLGLQIETIPGPKGKREMIRGIKI